jgi:hypothetical protein
MSSTGFFGKLASVDPIAQALNLPGSHDYVNAQINAHMPSTAGPYSGQAPTLAGANAGYAPGGPGADPMWRQAQPWHQGGLLGSLQSAATIANPYAAVSAGPGAGLRPTNPGTGPVGQINPYAAAAQKAGGGNLYGQ